MRGFSGKTERVVSKIVGVLAANEKVRIGKSHGSEDYNSGVKLLKVAAKIDQSIEGDVFMIW